jgi:hypothetical protein
MQRGQLSTSQILVKTAAGSHKNYFLSELHNLKATKPLLVDALVALVTRPDHKLLPEQRAVLFSKLLIDEKGVVHPLVQQIFKENNFGIPFSSSTPSGKRKYDEDEDLVSLKRSLSSLPSSSSVLAELLDVDLKLTESKAPPSSPHLFKSLTPVVARKSETVLEDTLKELQASNLDLYDKLKRVCITEDYKEYEFSVYLALTALGLTAETLAPSAEVIRYFKKLNRDEQNSPGFKK